MIFNYIALFSSERKIRDGERDEFNDDKLYKKIINLNHLKKLKKKDAHLWMSLRVEGGQTFEKMLN